MSDTQAGELVASTPHVLLVDDDPYFIKLLVHQFQSLGIENLSQASSGSQALFALNQSDDIELIVCDLRMPAMNGVEFLHQLEFQGFSGSVILISGEEQRVLDSVGELARAYGMTLLGVLGKPARRQQLEAMISRHYELRTAAQAGGNDAADVALTIPAEPKQLKMLFQPRLTVGESRLIGIEALALPGLSNSLSAAAVRENYHARGCSQTLTRHILEYAMQHVRALGSASEGWSLSVGILASELLSTTLPDILQQFSLQADFPLTRIILQIHGVPDASDNTRILDVCNRLFLQGVRLALDGAAVNGYQLERLMQLPFSVFRLDPAFIHGIHQRKHGAAILKSQTELAKRLGLAVLADGVESREELDAVRQAGCEQIQGTCISPPLALEELQAWAARFKRQQT